MEISAKTNRSAKRRRKFTVEPMEPRVLLSASPGIDPALLAAAQTTVALQPAGTQSTGLQPQVQAPVNWVGSGSGNWDVASNWSSDAIPGAGDDVVITQTGITITVEAGNQAAHSLMSSANIAVAGGSLTLGTDSQITGALTVNNSTLTTNGTLTASGSTTLENFGTLAGTGTLVLSDTATITNSFSLNASVNNSGTLTFGSGNLDLGSGATLTNESGGIFDLSGNVSVNAPGIVANAGTLNNTGGSNTVNATFNNTGTLHVTGGSFQMLNSGTSSGLFNVDEGTTLDFYATPNGINYQIAPGAAWNGAGLYLVTNFATVTLSDPTVTVSPENFELDDFSGLAGPGNLTIPSGGAFTWSGGTMSGPGTTTISTGATLTSGAHADFLDTRTIDNSGTINFSSTGLDIDNALIKNEAGAIFTFANSSTDGGALQNNGTFTSSGNSTIDSLTNSGAASSTGGTLTVAGGSGTGSFDASSSANISFDGFTAQPNSSWNGAGTYLIGSRGGATIAAGASITAENVTVDGDDGGTLTVNGSLTIPSGGTFNAEAGEAEGSGQIIIASGGTTDIGNINTSTFVLDGLTVTSNGPTNYFARFLSIEDGATFVNAGTFTVNAQSGGIGTGVISAGTTLIGGTGTFDNEGTFIDNAISYLEFDGSFNNNGSLAVNAATVAIYPEGSFTSGTSGGSFDVATGQSLTFNESQTFTAGVSFNGAGLYVLTGDGESNSTTITLADPSINLSPLDFQLAGGLFAGTGKITVTNGATFDVHFGTIGNTGGFVVQSGGQVITTVQQGTFNGTNAVDFVGTTVTNDGSITLTNGLIYIDGNTTFNNNVDGTIAAGGITSTTSFGNSRNGTFNNLGTLILDNDSSGANVFTEVATFNNEGTVEVDTGLLKINSAIPQISADGTTLTGGTWIVTNGSTIAFQLPGTNGTTLTTNDASVTLNGASSDFDAFANTLAENDGSLSLLNGASLTTPAALDNTGTMELGLGSALNVTGDYQQSSGATLTVHISGDPSNGQYGSLAVSGTAALDGALHVDLDGAFSLVAGTTFPILSYTASTGAFASQAGIQPAFTANQSDTSYLLTVANVVLPKLEVSNVAGPASTVSGQPITVNYTVTNNGGSAAAGDWTDSIYLSPGTAFDALTAVLLGRVEHDGGLDQGASYNGTITAPAPALPPGNYSILVVSDSRGSVAQSDRSGDTAPSAQPVSIGIQQLTLGSAVSGTIDNGQEELYEFNLQGNSQVKISLGTAVAAGAELYVSYNAVPTPATFDETAFTLTGTSAQILLPGNNPGPYYVLVRGRESSAGGQGFTLEAQDTSFGITSYTPTGGSGTTTITLQGSQFSPNTQVSLIADAGSNQVLTPTSIYYQSNTTLSATFNLTGIPAGSTFDIQAKDSGVTSTVPAAFTVGAPQTGVTQPVLVTITAPANVRTGQVYTIQVNYTNVTSQDQEAPLITLEADAGLLRLQGDVLFASSTIAFLGINTSGGPVGTLPPGYQGSLTVEVKPTNPVNHTFINYSFSLADPSLAFDYNAIEPLVESAAYTPAEWAQISTQLQSTLGPTQANYLAALSHDATELPAIMGENTWPIDDLQISVAQAAAAVSTSITGTVTSPSSGILLAGQLLHATNSDTGDSFATYVLNDGTFVLPELTAGDYTFTIDGTILGSTTPVSVAADQQVTGVTLAATSGATVLGTTKNSADGTTLSGITIQAIGSDGTIFATDSGANGQYTLTGLPTDTYTVVATGANSARLVENNITVTQAGAVLNLTLDPQSQITGTIQAPLGAVVQILAQATGTTDSLDTYETTSSDGTFDLAGLPAGSYDLQFLGTGLVPVDLPAVAVAAGQTNSSSSVSLLGSSTISGQVSGSAGETLSGLDVSLLQGSSVVLATTTLSDGSYSLTGVAPGTYTLQLTPDSGFVATQPLTITAAEAATGVNFNIEAGGIINGIVTNQANSQPVGGLLVVATDSAGNQTGVTTDASGDYSIAGLATGTYTIFTPGQSASRTVTVSDPSGNTSVQANLNITFNQSAVLSGTVLGSNNAPITNGTVSLLQNGQTIATTTLNANGQYQFILNSGGTFDLQAASGFGTIAGVTGITVAAGQTLTENLNTGANTLNVAVSGSGSITGTLVTVYLITGNTETIAGDGYVDATGAVQIPNLSPGNYVAKASLGDQFAEAMLAVAGNRSVSLNLAAAFTLSGTVTGPGAAPLANAQLTLIPENEPAAALSGSSDSTGAYSFSQLAPGTYDLIAFAAGAQVLIQTGISVAADTQMNVALSASQRSVTGTIVDSSGNPLHTGTVTAKNAAGQIVGQASIGPTGTFDVDSLPSDPVTLLISSPGTIPNLQSNVTVAAGQTLAVGNVTLADLSLAQIASVASPGLLPASIVKLLNLASNLATPSTQTFGQTVLDYVGSILGIMDPGTPGLPSCPTCMGAWSAAMKAVNARDNFRNNTLLPAGEELNNDAGQLIGAFVLETAVLAGKLAALYLAIQGVTVAQALTPLIGTGAAAGASNTLLAYNITNGTNALITLINSIASEATSIQQANSVTDLKSGIEAVKNLGLALFNQFKSLNTLAAQAPSTNPVIQKLGIVGGLVGLLITNPYTQTLSWATPTGTGYDNFKKSVEEWQKRRDLANQALTTLQNCEAGSSMGCGNSGGGGGSGSGGSGPGGGTQQRAPGDPNNLSGPVGYGSQNFLQASQPLGYTVNFENEPNADAPAQQVVITDVLAANLDLSTFSLGNISFGAITLDVPAGLTTYSTLVNDVSATGVDVQVTASLDSTTRTVTWTLTSIDPATGDQPSDVLVGFLPPDLNTPEGAGFVSFNISPVAGQATGSTVSDQASVVFDTNAAIPTPTVTNTLDAAGPTSHVQPLPTQSGPDLTLSWLGTDDIGGSGLKSFSIYESVNGAAYQPFLLNTTQTAADFTGIVGDTYSFYSIATDNVGNVQAVPAQPDATVMIVPGTTVTVDAKHPFKYTDASGNPVTVKLTGPGSAVASLVYEVANDGNLRSLVFSNTTAATNLSITITKVNGKSDETAVGRITTSGTDEGIGTITLGAGVTLGDGLDDLTNNLSITGTAKALNIPALANYAQLVVGSGLTTAQAAKNALSLTLGSVIGFGTSTNVEGSISALHLQGSFGGFVSATGVIGSITALGPLSSAIYGASIGNIKTPALTGATIVAQTGNIGNVSASKGGIANSTIQANSGNIGNITAGLVNATGAAGAIDTDLFTAENIGNVTATVTSKAGLISAFGIGNSSFAATSGRIGNISAKISGPASLTAAEGIDGSAFKSATAMGAINATVASPSASATLAGIRASDFTAGTSIGNITAAATGTAPAPLAAGNAFGIQATSATIDFNAGTSIGTIRVTADGAGGNDVGLSASQSDRIQFSAGSSVGTVTVSAAPGKAANAATFALSHVDLTAGGAVGKIAIGGDADFTQVFDLQVYAGGSIAGIAITSKNQSFGSLSDSTILAGQLQSIAKSTDLAKAGIGSVSISGSFFDDQSGDSTIGAQGNIGTVKIGNAFQNARIVAGLNAGADHLAYTADDAYNDAASIASLTVGGAFSDSSIVAGINPGADFTFGSGDDSAGASISGIKTTGKIGAITLGAATLSSAGSTVFKSPAAANQTSAIEAVNLTSIKIGKLPVFKDFTAPVWIDANGDGTEQTTETLIRVVS